MGFAKESQLEADFRGYGYSDKSICPNHFGDDVLQSKIRATLSEAECSFCDRSDSSQPIAAPFDDFMETFMVGVNCLFRPAEDEGVPCAGGYFAGTHDSYDVSESVLAHSCCEPDSEYEILGEIQRTLASKIWVDTDWHDQSPAGLMPSSWAAFQYHVKHEARFLFMDQTALGEFSIAEFFRNLVKILEESEGVHRTLRKGSSLFRGRTSTVSPDVANYTAKELGSPPVDVAVSNRMSPAGISMFYGSDSVDTVVAELSARSTDEYVIAGRFDTTIDMQLVDLASLPDPPSIFDFEQRGLYYNMVFLRGFAEDIRKPVTLDGREHIDYVPTQIFTEYLRLAAPYPVDGLVFNSAQSSGQNTVLFCDAQGCVDRGHSWLGRSKLELDPGSRIIRRIRP